MPRPAAHSHEGRGGGDPPAKGNSAVASKVAGSRARGMKHRVASWDREKFFFSPSSSVHARRVSIHRLHPRVLRNDIRKSVYHIYTYSKLKVTRKITRRNIVKIHPLFVSSRRLLPLRNEEKRKKKEGEKKKERKRRECNHFTLCSNNDNEATVSLTEQHVTIQSVEAPPK